MKLSTLLKTALLPLLLAAPIVKADSVTVTITVDNGYGFGYGDQNGIYTQQYYGGLDNCSAEQIFGSACYTFVSPDGTVQDTGPEIYNINASPSDFIYIVAWSDDAVAQGAVASFTDNTTGTTVTTSPAWPWQVFATGTNWQPNCGGGAHGPPLTGSADAINSQIAVANANAGTPGTSSVGWVGAGGVANGSLYFGGTGNAYSDFNYEATVPACIAPGAQWMEYDPEPANSNCNPFDWGSVNDYNTTPNFLREYLIYRIGPLSQLTSSNVCTNACINIYTPTNIVVNACSNTTVFFTASATDTCCSNVAVVCTPPSGSFFPPGTTTVTCDASDACGNSNFCSFDVTVQCTSNCVPVIECPSNMVVEACSNVPVFYSPAASNTCGGGVTVVCTPPSGSYFAPNTTTTVNCVATDGGGNSNSCSFTVTVQCTNNCTGCQACCGTNLGTRTIQWLQLPTNVSTLAADPTGANGNNTWIVTNLPGYGNVLITQDIPVNGVNSFTKSNPSFDNPPGPDAAFDYTEAGYGPYSWGVIPGTFGMYNTETLSNLNFNVNFYFLDGPPNPCQLVLGVAGVGEDTTVTASQPMTFRTECDLPAVPSAITTLDGAIPVPAGSTGTVVGSAYSLDGYGDPRNTGLALLQFDNSLQTLTTNDVPTGSGPGWPGLAANVPYLTLGISAQNGDGFGVTLGYIICTNNSTNCVPVIECPSNMVVEACSNVPVFYSPAASDTCDSNVTVVCTPPSGSYFAPNTTTTVNCVATDGGGNSNSCSFTVTITCAPTNVVYQGFINTASDYATFIVTNGSLVFSNLGTSGLNTLTIAIPPTLTALEVHWLPLDPTNLLPTGAYIQSQVVGTAGGIANGVLGTATMTKAGTSNYVVSADFSPIGASNFTVQAYLNGVMVGQATNLTGASLAVANEDCQSIDNEGYTNPSFDWGTNPASVYLGGATVPVACDQLIIIPQNGSVSSALTALQITAYGVPDWITITSENESLVYQGLTNTSLGIAIASNPPCCISNLGSGGQDGLALVITNLGSSGQDGVSIALPANLTGLTVTYLPLDDSNTLPVGAYVQDRLVGTANGATNVVLGAVTVTKECAVCGGSNYVLSADFNWGATTNWQLVEDAYLNGILVGRTTNQGTGPSAYCPVWPPQIDWETNDEGSATLSVHWPLATAITLAGGASVTCDELLITPQNAPPDSGLTAFQFVASQVPAITITSEILNPTLNLTCPNDIITNQAAGECSQTVSFAPIVTGNPAPNLVCTLNGSPITSPYSFPVGVNVVTCTAKNAAGVATCSFTVTVSNTPPVAGTNTLSTTQGVSASVAEAKVLLRDTSLSGGPLSITGVVSPTPNGASVILGQGLVNYTPPAGFIGLDAITYTLSDGCGTAQGTISVTVLATNLPSENMAFITHTATSTTVVFYGIPGVTYQIQSAPTPNGPWTNLGNPLVTAQNGSIQYTDTTFPQPSSRFYRTQYVSGL